jgi:membrane-associated phospholipid phosphatase
MVAGYGAFVAVVALTRIDHRGMPWVLAAHLALPLVAWLSTRAPQQGIGAFLRSAYPVLLLPALYSSIDVLNGFGAAHTFDTPLLALEEALFGMQPARDWWRSAPSTFWSTVLHAAYFSYYVVVPLPIVVFLATRQREASERYLMCVSATFLACYVVYVLAPVAGPYYEFARPTGEFVANAPARWVYAGLAKGSAFGAAFPSSHVAATVAATFATWSAAPRLARILAVPTALLTVGVVYCQMHYVVDSLAGVAVGVLVPVAIRRISAVTPQS